MILNLHCSRIVVMICLLVLHIIFNPEYEFREADERRQMMLSQILSAEARERRKLILD